MAAFDPKAYLAEKETDLPSPKGFDPKSYLAEKEGSAGPQKGLLARTSDWIQSRTTAPSRAALGAIADGNSAIDAFGEQWGEDPETAPTGQEVARKFKIDDKPVVSDDEWEDMLATDPLLARDSMGYKTLGVTHSGLAGTGIDVLADPLNLVPAAAPVLRGAGRAINAAGDASKAIAETQMFRALGPSKAAVAEATAKGNVRSIGRQLLDDGVAKGKGLLKPVASRETMAERINSKQGELAGKLNGILESAANAKDLTREQEIWLKSQQFKPNEAATILKDKIRQEYSHVPKKVLEQRLSVVDEWLSGDTPMSITDAQKFKQQMQNFIKDKSYWQGNPNASQEALLGIRKSIKEGIEKNADAFSKVIGGAGGEVKETNRQLGQYLQAGDIIDDANIRDNANRMVSLTDMIAGAGGGASGNSPTESGINGLAAMAGNMLLRRFGRQASAMTLDKVGDALKAFPEFRQLSEQNPKVFSAVVGQMGAKNVSEASGASSVAGEQAPQDVSLLYGPSSPGLVQRRKLAGPGGS